MWKEFFCAGTTPRYWWLNGLLMGTYVAAMLAVLRYAHAITSPLPRAAVALAPILPVLGFVVLEFARIRATDELRQRIELEAATLALALGIPLLLALSLLDDVGVVHVPLLMAAPLLALTYALAQMWAHWRYR